jgi:hypothetical protein
VIARKADPGDMAGVLCLQEKNLYDRLSAEQREKGFVTTPFSAQQLSDLINLDGLFILEVTGKICGYTMAAGWDYFSQWPIFPLMLNRLTGRVWNHCRIGKDNTFEYGPICIDASLRGTNAFPVLFECMRNCFESQFPVGITFINQVNERSVQAHTRKLGMTIIDEFEFNDRHYFGLAFDTKLSVLSDNPD